MVDENLIRADVSFAEMAALAQAYADDPASEAVSLDDAVQRLFGSAGKQKRSYIRAFAKLLDLVGPAIRHPDAIPRALGLSVRKRLEDEPESLPRLQQILADASPQSVEAELAILKEFSLDPTPQQAPFPVGNGSASMAKRPRPARTTFQVQSRIGPIKCTASQGRLELRGDADFSALERRRLEEAVKIFLMSLDGEGNK
jgi:ParB family chromosome partitioning protein